MRDDEGVKLCQTPNQHAGTPRAHLLPDVVVVRGYQEYVLTRHAVIPRPTPKSRLLAPWISRRFMAGRSVLDLGANAGLHSFWALNAGASRSTAVDLDEAHLAVIERGRDHLAIPDLKTVQLNVVEWSEPADVVFALALVHWVYSCTAVLGSLARVAAFFRGLTRDLLFTEWIAPEDPAIQFFGHLDWNAARIESAYTRELFEGALRAEFARVHDLGEASPTRRLYACFVHAREVDATCPLPLLGPPETVRSSRNLVRNEGVEYWSRIYREPGAATVLKQTSLDLARREHVLLRRLKGPHFPRVLEERTDETSSAVTIEYVPGPLLGESLDALRRSRAAFAALFRHALAILAELASAGIVHRDIRAENVILRSDSPTREDGGAPEDAPMPVLIDFGWAVAPGLELSAPPLLGMDGRPPDGTYCDVYATGIMLGQVKGEAYPEYDPLIGLMTSREASLRVTDVRVLRLLLRVVEGADPGQRRARGEEGMVEIKSEAAEGPEALRRLLEHAALQQRHLAALRARIEALEGELGAKERTLETLSVRLLDRDPEAAAAARLEAALERTRGLEADLCLAAERGESLAAALRRSDEESGRLAAEVEAVAALLPVRERLDSLRRAEHHALAPEDPAIYFVVYGPAHVRHVEEVLIPALAAQEGLHPRHLYLMNYLDNTPLFAAERILGGVRVSDLSPSRPAGRIGYGEALNRLFEFVSPAPLFFILNPDTLPRADFSRSLLAAFQEADVGIVEARQWPSEHPKEVDEETAETPWASGACLLVNSRAFRRLGGFDPTFFLYCEDVDLSWRMWLSGHRVVYCKDAVCEHHTGLHVYASDRFYGEHYYSAVGYLLLSWKYFGEPGERRALLAFERAGYPAALRAQVLLRYRDARERTRPLPVPPVHPKVKITGFNLYHAVRSPRAGGS